MQFLLIARDGRDAEALDRRLRVRDQHLAPGDELVRQGHMLYGSAILDDDGQMVGSMLVLDFPSRAELDEWLAKEPYVLGDVWADIKIMPTRVGPSFTALHR
jgi:uncharacterized protein